MTVADLPLRHLDRHGEEAGPDAQPIEHLDGRWME